MWGKDDISQQEYSPPPPAKPVFTAEQARLAAEKYHAVGGDLYNRITLKIMKEIEDTARRGGRALYITKFFDQLDFTDRKAVEQHLKAVGYEVESTSDQRDGDFHQVTW